MKTQNMYGKQNTPLKFDFVKNKIVVYVRILEEACVHRVGVNIKTREGLLRLQNLPIPNPVDKDHFLAAAEVRHYIKKILVTKQYSYQHF